MARRGASWRRGMVVVGVVSVLVAATVVAMVPTRRAFGATFSLSVAFGGHGELSAPTAIAFAPDGRIFVAEEAGTIEVYDSIADSSPTLFADLSTEVYSAGNHGLLGLAVDPQFPTRPYVYALYSRDSKTLGGAVPAWNDTCTTPTPGCLSWGRLVRLTAQGDVAIGTPTVLIDDWCNQFGHTVDSLQFGSDGMLYASAGDGGTQRTVDYGQYGSPPNPCGDPPGGVGTALSPPTTQGGSLRSQDVRTNRDPAGLDGTIIRIDPDTGAAAPGNPFASSADANKRRIIAYGLRNPFRFTFRPGTNDAWIADAGWNSYEELDRITDTTAGHARNFGWPCYEGPSAEPDWSSLDVDLCNSLYAHNTSTAPAFAYPDDGSVVAGDGCTPDANFGTVISGDSFYTGTAYPSRLHGALFFVDYGRACLYAAPPNAKGVPNFNSVRVVTRLAAPGISDIERGPGGDLFLVNNANSTILRLQYG